MSTSGTLPPGRRASQDPMAWSAPPGPRAAHHRSATGVGVMDGGGARGRWIAGLERARRLVDSGMHAAAARRLRVRCDVGHHPHGIGRCRRHVCAAAQRRGGVRGAVAGPRRAAGGRPADAVAARDHRRRRVAEDRPARAPARDRAGPRAHRPAAAARQPARRAAGARLGEDRPRRDGTPARGGEAADRALPRAAARHRSARAHAAPQRRTPGTGADRRPSPARAGGARRAAARARAARPGTRAVARRTGRLPRRRSV